MSNNHAGPTVTRAPISSAPESPEPKAAKQQHWYRQWLIRLVMIAVGFVIALVATEVLLRTLSLAPAGGLATVNEREYRQLPGIYTPNQRLIDRTQPKLPFRVTIDSLGYRGTRQISRAKPAGEIRVLMLGDSFTFGYLVDDDKTMSALVESRLQARCAAGQSIRVVNAGLGGSSIETAAVMAERALPLGIDIAVVTFSENDVTDLADPMWVNLTANRAAKSRFPMSVVYPVVRHLALWNVLLKVEGKIRNTHIASVAHPSAMTQGVAADSSLLRLRAEYRERLSRLRDMLTGANIPLLFAIAPSANTVYSDNSGEQVRWAGQTARDLGIPVVDFTPALKRDGRPKEQLYMLPIDGHPSAAGYAAAEPGLEATLVGTPPLAQRCTSEATRPR